MKTGFEIDNEHDMIVTINALKKVQEWLTGSSRFGCCGENGIASTDDYDKEVIKQIEIMISEIDKKSKHCSGCYFPDCHCCG